MSFRLKERGQRLFTLKFRYNEGLGFGVWGLGFGVWATEVEVIGLNEASATLVDKFAVHDKDGADDMLMGH